MKRLLAALFLSVFSMSANAETSVLSTQELAEFMCKERPTIRSLRLPNGAVLDVVCKDPVSYKLRVPATQYRTSDDGGLGPMTASPNTFPNLLLPSK